jgi:hypothetical protein
MTEETYYFNGIRIDGEYGVEPMTPKKLIEKINEEVYAREEELRNLKAELNSSHQSTRISESVIKILFDLNQQNLQGKLTTQDAWLGKLARELSVLILGEENVKPGNVKNFTQRLRADPWETLQNVITLARMKNETLLAELMLSIPQDEGAAADQKEFLKTVADHIVADVSKKYFDEEWASSLSKDKNERKAWLDAWLWELRRVQLESIKHLSNVEYAMLEAVETLLRTLLHPAVPLVQQSSDWIKKLTERVYGPNAPAHYNSEFHRTQRLEAIFEELKPPDEARPVPPTTATCWFDSFMEALIELYLQGGKDTPLWYVFLDTLEQHLSLLCNEVGDVIAWKNLLLIFKRWLSEPKAIDDIPTDTLRIIIGHLGVPDWIDPTNLQQTGWGIIFPQYMDKERLAKIKAALEPLLRHRLIQTDLSRLNLQEDVDKLYKKSLDDIVTLRDDKSERLPNWQQLFWIYEGPEGYRPGDTGRKFMGREPRHADPARLVDPEKGNVPYYLLIVGNPEEIPFGFLYGVDVQFSVGRLDFGDDYDAYRRYAENVVAAERGETTTSTDITFFAVQNPGDKATQLSQQYLAQPLRDNLEKRHTDGWTFSLIQQDDANKDRFLELLQQATPPALLFTTSHGLEFDYNDPLQRERQEAEQGALICGDWPEGRDRKVEPRHYVAGKDVREAPNLNVRGMMAFLFACYGAGTPLYDEYSRQKFKNTGEPIAARPFVADLPKALLENGALAVVGHVERAWGTSFLGDDMSRKARKDEHIAVFESALDRLLNGHPIGSAMDDFSSRYAALATELTALQATFSNASDVEIAQIWTAHNDARGYVVIGDPAVRLGAAKNKITEH